MITRLKLLLTVLTNVTNCNAANIMLGTTKNNVTKKTITAGLDQLVERSIEFVELVFDDIIDNKNISNKIKVLLLRLQIPIVKVSIHEQEHCIDSDHPAIILLNIIADTSTGKVKYTSDIYILIDKIITNILAEHKLTTGTFQSALNIFSIYLTKQSTSTDAKETKEKSLAQRNFARTTTLTSLRTATVGKILPVEVHSLILKRWPTLMFNHCLANGRDNSEWTMIMLTLRQIIDSVQPITSPTRLEKIKQTKDDLFRQTENFLHIYVSSNQDIKNVMSAYKATVHRQISSATHIGDKVAASVKNSSKAKPDNGSSNKSEGFNRAPISPDVIPGMWFKLYMGKGKSSRRCKLSVILDEDTRLMFVNHKGELVVEKSFDEFNAEMANKTSKIIMDNSLFDNTLNTTSN